MTCNQRQDTHVISTLQTDSPWRCRGFDRASAVVHNHAVIFGGCDKLYHLMPHIAGHEKAVKHVCDT